MSAGLITVLSVAFIVVFVVVFINCLVISHSKRQSHIDEENNCAEAPIEDTDSIYDNIQGGNSMSSEYKPIIEEADRLELENEIDALADEADTLDIQAARLGIPSDGAGKALRIVYLVALLMSVVSVVMFLIKLFVEYDSGSAAMFLYLLGAFFVLLFIYWFISALSTMRTALLTMNKQLVKTNKRLDDIARSLSKTQSRSR